jgi:hypothetical protein
VPVYLGNAPPVSFVFRQSAAVGHVMAGVAALTVPEIEEPAAIVLVPSALLMPELVEGTVTVKVLPGVRPTAVA